MQEPYGHNMDGDPVTVVMVMGTLLILYLGYRFLKAWIDHE